MTVVLMAAATVLADGRDGRSMIVVKAVMLVDLPWSCSRDHGHPAEGKVSTERGKRPMEGDHAEMTRG